MKTYTITSRRIRTGSENSLSGTIPELVEYYGYTLECGESWQHERGNKKINTNPKTIKSLVNNLNNAVNNSAADGNGGTYYFVS